MPKKYYIILALAGAAFYFFIYKPPLPVIGGSGKIGKKFTGSFDGTKVSLNQAITNQQDATDLFNAYPAIQIIADVTGTTFTRS